MIVLRIVNALKHFKFICSVVSVPVKVVVFAIVRVYICCEFKSITVLLKSFGGKDATNLVLKSEG